MNISYDLIIVAKSSREDLKRVTQRCIDTALADGEINVIVVETSGNIHKYTGVSETVLYSGPFCYNRALNMGLERAKGNVHILANNDLLFHPGWGVMGEQMYINDYHSACALSQDPRQRVYARGDFIYPGYSVGYHIVGWCIFVTKECITKIGKLDESFEFWYSDNMYAEQIQSAGIRHGLFCNVQIDHVTSVTLRTLAPRDQRKYSFNARNKYNALKNAV